MEFLEAATPYRPRRTDYEHAFDAFLAHAHRRADAASDAPTADTVIQFVVHPNFEPMAKAITWYAPHADGGFSALPDGCPPGYARANSFKNFKTGRGVGHAKGLFFELNAYTRRGAPSAHHTSTVSGAQFDRDASHDGASVPTKGLHW